MGFVDVTITPEAVGNDAWASCADPLCVREQDLGPRAIWLFDRLQPIDDAEGSCGYVSTPSPTNSGVTALRPLLVTRPTLVVAEIDYTQTAYAGIPSIRASCSEASVADFCFEPASSSIVTHTLGPGLHYLTSTATPNGNFVPYRFEFMAPPPPSPGQTCQSALSLSASQPTQVSFFGGTPDPTPGREGYVFRYLRFSVPSGVNTFVEASGAPGDTFWPVEGTFTLFASCPTGSAIPPSAGQDNGWSLLPAGPYYVRVSLPEGASAGVILGLQEL